MNYHVKCKRKTHVLGWEYETDVNAENELEAQHAAYFEWITSYDRKMLTPESDCIFEVSKKKRIFSAVTQTEGEQAFVKELETKVSKFLESKLDGEFKTVNYPSGFHYGITYGNNAFYNQQTLEEFDSMIGKVGEKVVLTGEKLSDFYYSLLQSIQFKFSQTDKKKMDDSDQKAEAQIANVITAFENAGGTFSAPLPFGGKIQDIINQTKEVNQDELPLGLKNALAAYREIAVESSQLHDKWYNAMARLNAAKKNIIAPSAKNGGLQVSGDKFYVGYKPMPSATKLIDSLNTKDNKVSIDISLSDYSQNSYTMSLSGGLKFKIPVAKIMNIGMEASANYDLSKYASSTSTVTMNIQYPGITTVSNNPSELSSDNSTGWYSKEILREVVEKTGKDSTGYQLVGEEYNVNKVFAVNGIFSRLKTFVICQEPTITLSFTGEDVHKITSDFKVDAHVKLNLLGFKLGSVDGTYKIGSVKEDTKKGTVTVTFGPTEISGTIPLQQQVSYVLGGVCSFPPIN